MHREEQHRAVEEHDAERVERIVEEVAVADRERRRPIQMREDTEGYCLTPRTHEERPDEAQHEIEPHHGREGPEGVAAEPQLIGPAIGAVQPQEDRQRQREARHQPPAALVQRHQQTQAVLGQRRLERQPEQVADEQNRVPVHRGQHVEPDDLDGDEAKEQRQHAGVAEVDRPQLRVAQLARQMAEDAAASDPRVIGAIQRHARIERPADLHSGEEILIFGHVLPLPYMFAQKGRSSHQVHHSGQPRVQNGPLMTMQMADQMPAPSARNRPSLWMPRVPIE